MSRANKDKGNRGEREWRDVLRYRGVDAERKKDGLVDVDSEFVDIHWEVKRQESPKNFYKWIAQAEKDAERLGRKGVVAFRKNYHPWRCIVPADLLVDLLLIRKWAVSNGFPSELLLEDYFKETED
jgi:Holliday junction resolvase